MTASKPDSDGNSQPQRKVFATSRRAEFCSKDDLEKQTGHKAAQWLLVIAKELIDNAIDEAEKIGISPEVAISIVGDKITVADNGPGIAPEIVKRIIKFTDRVSEKQAYVAPTRGQQGNALMTILAMPYVLDGKPVETVIEARGIRHRIVFDADPISREPVVTHSSETGTVNIGTQITVSASSMIESAEAELLPFVDAFTLINPHLSLRMIWNGDVMIDAGAIDPGWSKWSPRNGEQVHWYTPNRLSDLMAAHLRKDQEVGGETTVRDFVGIFRGLSSTVKRSEILGRLGVSRLSLAKFFDNGKNHENVQQLLSAMQEECAPTKPKDLGVIGRDTLKRHFEEAGAEIETFRHCQKSGICDGVPWIVETAFAWFNTEHDDEDEERERHLITSVNFSPAIINPFRYLGHNQSLDDVLTDRKVGAEEPVMMFVHLVCPRLSFTDRGKGVLVLGNVYGSVDDDYRHYELTRSANELENEIGNAIISAVTEVTARWTKARKAEERGASAEQRRSRMLRSSKIKVKHAAGLVMEEAYRQVAGPRRLVANARQIMYKARPMIQTMTGETFTDGYFTQTLLPNYVIEHQVNWNVAFDDRGTFIEPHSKHEFGIGTVNVREYLDSIGEPIIEDGKFVGAAVKTLGPKGNFGALLYIEKEGFLPLLDEVDLANRFDIAIMSNKGFSVTASRILVDRICSERGIPLFVLHDFDKAGLGISATLYRSGRRYQFKNKVHAIDLGLRLADVRALGLESSAEMAAREKGSREKRAANMRRNGATEEEVEFLLDRRVELNALTSEQFVEFIERGLTEHGIRKIMPNPNILAETFQAHARAEQVRKIVDRAISGAAIEDPPIPDNLVDQVADLLQQNPSWRWDAAVAEIVLRRDSED